mgnify:CR=1 FL=1
MVSAVNIENLDKEGVVEHFFNDVKYATVSLDKDIHLIREQYKETIFDLDYIPMKRRLSEEYKIFMRPTYDFLQFDRFSFSQTAVSAYMEACKDIFESSLSLLDQLNSIRKRFVEAGIVHCDTYQDMLEVIDLCSLLEDTYPTRYWLDSQKYDFMQEMMNESQTMVEELNATMNKLKNSWNMKVLDYENVEAVDYVIEKSKAGLKLFDLSFHKARKTLKDLFIDENRTFSDEEIEQLHKYIYIYKKNDFWVSRNLNRIGKILGENYKGCDTDFMKLRNDYALVEKFAKRFLSEETNAIFLTCISEKEQREAFFELVFEAIRIFHKLDYKKLIQVLPSGDYDMEHVELGTLYHGTSCFYHAMIYLEQDLRETCLYCHDFSKKENYTLDDMRKVLYALERIDEKSSWLNEHKLLITELFGDKPIGADSDWSTLREQVMKHGKHYGSDVIDVQDEPTTIDAHNNPNIIDTQEDSIITEQVMIEQESEEDIEQDIATERNIVDKEILEDTSVEESEVEETVMEEKVTEEAEVEETAMEERVTEETEVEETAMEVTNTQENVTVGKISFGTIEENASYVNITPLVNIQSSSNMNSTVTIERKDDVERKSTKTRKRKKENPVVRDEVIETYESDQVPEYLAQCDYTNGDPFPVYEETSFEGFLAIAFDRCSTKEAMDYVLSAEAPIREDLMLRKIAIALQLVRATPSLKEEVSQLLRERYHGYMLRGGFVTKENGYESLRLRRPSQVESKRDIATVSKEELQAATLTLLTQHKELTLDEIGKEIAKVLGYPRRTKKFNEIVEVAVVELRRNDIITRNSGGFCRL